MKKHLSFLLRVGLAILGIAFIAWSLDWRDKAEVPAGTRLPDGRVLAEPAVAVVVSGDFDPRGVTQPLTVAIDSGPAAGATLAVQPEQLGERVYDFRLRPGIVTTLRHADRVLLLLGLLLAAPIYPVQGVRWWLLMRARQLDVPLRRAVRLTMIGSFFNYCMPGMTGGDVVKAYYAARRTEGRGAAIMSVIFDRVCGLLGLVLLAGLAGLLMMRRDPLAMRITLYIWLAAAGVVVVSAAYFSQRLRRGIGLDALLRRLPAQGLLARVHDAAAAYGHHKGAVLTAILMSVPVHLSQACATALAGYALGLDLPLALLLTVLPIVFLAGTIPLTYQGLGVMEGLAMAMLLQPPLATPNHIVGMLLLLRVFLVVYALAGALFLLRGDVHLHPEASLQAGEAPAATRV